LLSALSVRFAHLVHELAKFGTVGAGAFVIDVGVFNLLRFGVGLGPLTSKTLSVTAAATFAYFGNRHWTWKHRDRTGLAREYALFFLLNAVGLAIALTCLATSHYLLGLQGPVADNVSANVVGLALGTTFRFWSYRRWVFLPIGAPPVDELTGLPHPESEPSPR
jgi:putative flippase GtrA